MPSQSQTCFAHFLPSMLSAKTEKARLHAFFVKTKFATVAAAVVTLTIMLQGPLLTRLDINLSSSGKSTSLGNSRLRSHSAEQRTGTNSRHTPRSTTSLRFDWSNLTLTSNLARAMQAHQSDCSLPLGDLRMRNSAGLGSDLHLWTQALCNGMQEKARVQTQLPWIFRDDQSCRYHAQETAMLCYFPHSELRCPFDRPNLSRTANRTRLYVKGGYVQRKCETVRKRFNATFADVRAAGVEYLFSQTGPLLIQEADRQLSQVFGDERPLPSQLITVHIRWGDKKVKMELRPIQEYIDAVQRLASDKNLKGPEVKVFLASEDPLAVQGFQEAAGPYQWKVFVDAYFQEFNSVRISGVLGNNPKMSKKLEGRPGLVALASVLIALQANDYVLTLESNWSRLINELRKNVLDPRCDSCTQMIDLTPKSFEY